MSANDAGKRRGAPAARGDGARRDGRTGRSANAGRSGGVGRGDGAGRSGSPGRSDGPGRSGGPGRGASAGGGREGGAARPPGRQGPGRPAGGGAAGASRAAPQRPQAPRIAVRVEQVQQVLGEILQWQYPADAVLSHWLRAHPGLGGRDRGELAEAVYDTLRHLRRYRQYAESGSGPAARRLALLGLAATLGMEALEPALAADEAQWLARVRRIALDTLPRAVRHSLPDWLDERLAALPEPDALAAELNRPAGLDIRVNPMTARREEVLAALRDGPAARHDPRPTPYSPWGIRLAGRPALNRWPLYENGAVEVQDEGSQLLALLVAPRRGEMIIDFCAGAGGKTLLLGALMRSTGRLYAMDVSAARLARAKPRLARSGLSNVATVAISGENDARVKRLAGKAHRVLVDAPCSGVGTLRRNPDLKWRQHPQALAELGALQARIVDAAARCVAPGGRLVYATCSLLREENEDQAEAFLARHPGFRLLDAGEILAGRVEGLDMPGPYLSLRPDVHGTDGFFAAVFERAGKEEAARGAAAAEEAAEEAVEEAGGEAGPADAVEPGEAAPGDPLAAGAPPEPAAPTAER